MDSKKITINNNSLFNIAVFFYLLDGLFLQKTNIDSLINSSIIDITSNVLRLALLLLFLIKAIRFDKINTNELFKLVVILSVIGTASIISHTSGMILSFIIIYIAKDTTFDNDLKTSLIVLSIITLITIALSGSGLILSTTKHRDVLNVSRTSMGFSHPNTLGLIAFAWVAEFLYINRLHKSFVKYLVTLGILCFALINTYSLTSVILTLALITFSMVQEILERRKKLPKSLLAFLVAVVLIIVSIVIIYYWKNPYKISPELKSLRARFTIAQRFINGYGINLLGHKLSIGSLVYIPGYGIGYGYLDNGYIRILLELGVLPFVIFFYYYFRSIKRIIKERETLMLIVAGYFLVYGFMEYNAFSAVFNIFLIKNIDYYH